MKAVNIQKIETGYFNLIKNKYASTVNIKIHSIFTEKKKFRNSHIKNIYGFTPIQNYTKQAKHQNFCITGAPSLDHIELHTITPC